MPLYNINDLYSMYRSKSSRFDIRNFEIYSDRNERIGRVLDTLLNQAGELQYLVVELSSPRAKHVLLSTQQAQIDPQNRYIYFQGLSLRQAEGLPAYHTSSAMPVSPEPIQPVHRMRSLEDSSPLEASVPLRDYQAAPTPPPINPSVPSPQPPIPPYTPSVEPAAVQPVPPPVEYFTQSPEVVPSPQPVIPPEVYRQQPKQEAIVPPPPPAPEIAQEEVIPLREERLIVDQKRRKVGEVVMRKEIETEIIEVPVQREKLIVEQVGDDPKRLAEIDLADEQLPPLSRQEVQLPKIPRHEP